MDTIVLFALCCKPVTIVPDLIISFLVFSANDVSVPVLLAVISFRTSEPEIVVSATLVDVLKPVLVASRVSASFRRLSTEEDI